MSKKTERSLDYREIQLKVGLEVHQQLATQTKLFCACPPFVGDDSGEVSDDSYTFRRILRPASSELGEIDEAAEFESRHIIRARYIASKTRSCLVEADEEPPHSINEEALETALLFALSLKSRVMDEIHVMRKIVVDGSNTSGFQRTAIISMGGELVFDTGKVGVQTIGLEEDAGRAVKADDDKEDGRTYALDRLGTALVEVALAPIEGTPDDVEIAARTLGRLMRSTRRVARGLGTIRQDLNISVMNGKVIEVKGVQRLEQIRKVVMFEAARQKFFYDLAKEVRAKVGESIDVKLIDATSIFSSSKSNVIRKALSHEDSNAVCLVVKGFSGFFGRENEFHSRLGKELGSIAKTYGLGGVFHSDELPNYGITEEELVALRNRANIGKQDAYVIVAGNRTKTRRAADSLKKRIEQTSSGVPAETRAGNLEGETTFLRPRPGAARMYPETDIPLKHVTVAALTELRREIPEPWEKQVKDFSEKYDLPIQLAEPMFDSERREVFEAVVKNTRVPSRYIASVLVDTFLALSRDGIDTETLKDESILDLFSALSNGRFAKEALPRILRQLSSDRSRTLDSLLAESGLGIMSEEELKTIIMEVIRENMQLVESRGTGAQSVLMGKVMQKVRGKADGKLVNDTIAKMLSDKIGKD